MIITFFGIFNHLAVHHSFDLTDLLLFALVSFFFIKSNQIFVLTYFFYLTFEALNANLCEVMRFFFL